MSRLRGLGLTTLQLPLSAASKEPRAPILVSKNLASALRIIVVFGESIQDLGIWAYRSIGTDGINAGSAVSFARAVLGFDNPNPTSDESIDHSKAKKSDTALVLANTGQLIWHCASGRTVTHASWLGLPRRSAVDPPVTLSQRNKISLNEDWQKHVECVFEEVLSARGKLVRSDAKIDVVGMAEGALGAVQYLANECKYSEPSCY